jgi:preprotein translocase subunit SecA
VQQDEATRPKKLFVDFTDGRRLIRVTVRPEDVQETGGQEINDALERSSVLSVIDARWVEHLRDLDEVKEGIGLRAYGQKDPLVEYKMEAYRLFAEMMQEISQEVISLVFKAGPLMDNQQGGRTSRRTSTIGQRPKLDRQRARTEHASSDANANYGVRLGGEGNGSAERDPTAKAAPVVVGETIGRNDPCPCGSGKKYKHCHGRA